MKSLMVFAAAIIFAIVIVLFLRSPSTESFTIQIDPSLKNEFPTIPAPAGAAYPVGVMLIPTNQTSRFVEGQVVYKPQSDAEKAAFLEKWNGEVLDSGTLPAPPASLRHRARQIPASSGYHRTRVELPSISDSKIIEYGKQIGLKGNYTFSSSAMLQTFAVVLEEQAHGNAQVTLNGVFTPDCYVSSTQEYAIQPTAPDPSFANDGYMDAFGIGNFNDPDIGVTDAWQLVELFGIAPGAVPLAVIDTGFVMNADFPTFSAYDFVDNDYNVDAHEGTYHGTRTLSIASARLDDRFGAAGTGGPVALPMPFRFDLSFSQGALAIRTAVSWGAEVINQSYGGDCNWFCETFGGGRALNEALDEAFDNGVVTVASAGNDEQDLDRDVYKLPAEGGSAGRGNIVVGALDLTTKRAARTATHGWGSNFGSALDTWIAVEPRIDSTPTPTAATISTIGRTSGASAYTSGVISLMKALAPSLSVAEVHEMVGLSNVASPDARVASGYLNVFDVVLRAATHADTIDPQSDELEPNDHWDTREIDPGEYCANLHSHDTEDGYWFWVDDIRPVRVREDRIILGAFDATLGGFHLAADESLPFDGVLVPGTYFVKFGNRSSDATFYQLSLEIDSPSAMSPDRFEVNDTLPTAAEIRLPGNQIGRTWVVDNINFHVSGDQDYFGLVLPDLPSLLYSDRITIWVEPDESGFSSPFNLFVYDDAGATLPDIAGSAATIENVRSAVPSGTLRFLIQDRMGRRNHYRILIGYDQFIRGPAPQAPPFAFMEIPRWPDPSDLYYLHVPGSVLDDAPFELPYPGDPTVAKALAEGEQLSDVPAEMMVLKWPEKGDFTMSISYAGNPQDMTFTLVDHNGEILTEAKDAGSTNKTDTQQATGRVHKRMSIEGMPRGIYGIKVKSSHFPMLYRVRITGLPKQYR